VSPVSISEGPLGIEAEHHFNGLILNRTALFPRYYIKKITNFHSLPEVEDVFTATRGRVGRTPFPVQNQGKTIVYEGLIQALTRESLRGARSAMVAAFADRWRARELRSVPDPALAAGGTAADGWFTYGRATDLTIDDEQAFAADASPSGWQRAFVLALHLYNPRWYLYDGSVEATGDSAVAIDNLGNAPTDPFITVPGVAGTVTVKRNSDDAQLRFDDLPAGALQLNFHLRTATVDGADVSARLNAAQSDWWDEGVTGLNPGADTVSRSGSGTSLTVVYFPASW
jgi:hypothetical protein